ncbi:50S ribosomal protein L1 [Candidatus Jidaibacter acanthamoebae]|nr:50S ribosomal protein L1 [Candidatus Jidaibacter acanthamoeba]
MAKLSKRLKKSFELVSENQVYSLDEALQIVKKYAVEAKTKFDETVDVVFKLGVDPRQSDQMVRGVVAMPNGLGKQVRVAVFAKPERMEEAKKAGADVVGGDDLVEEVKNGRLDFDLCIATPDMMVKVGTLGKVLGPKGMMPNPKLGTVSNDIAAAVKQAKSGQVEYKTEKAGLVHAGVGKVSFEESSLKENIIALYHALINAKPSSSKGVYMQKMHLSTSMGPSIPLDIQKVVS